MSDINLVNIPGTGALIRGDQGAGTRASADFLNFQKNNTETFSVDSAGLPDPGGNQATRQITIQIGDIVADSDAIEPFLMEFRGGVTITKAQLCVDTSTADGTTNKQTITILDSSDQQIAQLLTAANNPGVTQATWTDMGAITNAALTAGEYMYVTFAKTSAGLVMSGLTFLINYTMSS
ncbi:hypothetical protein LCGC14_2162700 [marine sediment metagenome]|uniref:Uncharacterized protein n=1 Tax=marine sediment metagenome TaxID=412755 RepID=A0A0F9GNE5_9ZZZZ